MPALLGLIPVAIEIHMLVLLIESGIVVAAQASHLQVMTGQGGEFLAHRLVQDQVAEEAWGNVQDVVEPYGTHVVTAMVVPDWYSERIFCAKAPCSSRLRAPSITTNPFSSN
jgi:hypothetical protein